MQQQTAIDTVSISEKLSQFTDTWSPKIVGNINDAHVKPVKLKGKFVWHHHKGHLLMRLRDRNVHLDLGEFIIIPRGVEHLPIADDECHVMLLEPKTTLNTGNATSDRTVAELDRI